MRAIRSASLFGRLLQQSPGKVLDEAPLAMRLERQERFNPERARQVAHAFHSSLADYGLIDGHGNVIPVRDDEAQEERTDEVDDETAPEDSVVPVMKSQQMQRVEVALPDDRLAVVMLPREVGTTDIRRICAILQAYTRSSRSRPVANKDDQILALLVDIRNRLSNLDSRLRRVEDEVERTHSDVVTAGRWTKAIHDRR